MTVKVSAVVFDQGNTLLLDPFASVMHALQGRLQPLFASYGISLDVQGITMQWAKSNVRINYPFIGHFYQEETIVHDVLKNLGVREDVMALLGLDLLRLYRTCLKEVIELDSRTREVRATLEQLKRRRKRMGVFSNDRAAGLGFVLGAMRVRSLFEFAETSESIGMEKPDRRVFQRVVDHFGCRPSDVAYIGDDPVRDIEAAKACGLKAILYREITDHSPHAYWRGHEAKAKTEADASVDRISDLLDTIE